jgi:hypothetical protein
MAVIPVPLTLLTGVGSMRLTVPADLRGADARRATLLMLRVGVCDRHPVVCLLCKIVCVGRIHGTCCSLRVAI